MLVQKGGTQDRDRWMNVATVVTSELVLVLSFTLYIIILSQRLPGPL